MFVHEEVSCLYIFSTSTLADNRKASKDSYKQSSAACGYDQRHLLHVIPACHPLSDFPITRLRA